MGIFDWLLGKKSKESEVKDVGIEKGEVKKKSKQMTTRKSAKKSKFALWTSGGVCDVCNEPLRTGAAFKIPVDVFYSSPKYRDWFNRNQMPILRDTYGVTSDITVDIVLANMRSDDPTEYSAVCDKCVELFL